MEDSSRGGGSEPAGQGGVGKVSATVPDYVQCAVRRPVCQWSARHAPNWAGKIGQGDLRYTHAHGDDV